MQRQNFSNLKHKIHLSQAFHSGGFRRVSKHKPCPVCGKPDWCLVSEDGNAVICPRIADGSVKKCGNAGWLHILNHNIRRKNTSLFSVNVGAKNNVYFKVDGIRKVSSLRLRELAEDLGVSENCLVRLSIGWVSCAYLFPMMDATRRIVGYRQRCIEGYKSSITGGKSGLFIPDGIGDKGILLVCEGESDTAAALDLGFDAIGRPNCNSCIDETVQFATGRDIVIVCDNDMAGIVGAERLAKKASLKCHSVKIVKPPSGINDLRDWLRAGLTHDQLLRIIKATNSMEVHVKCMLK